MKVNFVKATFCNVYAQILLTTRTIKSDGFGQKNRQWNQKNLIEKWRIQWELYANKALEKAGRKERIDRRSLKSQGLEKSKNQKSSKSSHEKKKADYQVVFVAQEFKIFFEAYKVWLKSQKIAGSKVDFQSFKDKLEEKFENKPKNKMNYREWAESVSQIQNEFLEQFLKI